jgi:hypothetical protein
MPHKLYGLEKCARRDALRLPGIYLRFFFHEPGWSANTFRDIGLGGAQDQHPQQGRSQGAGEHADLRLVDQIGLPKG